MTEPTDVLAAAVEVNDFCVSQGWKFCFIGGVAVQRWGNPRFTADVDLTLITGYDSERRFLDALLERFVLRRPDGYEFALTYRVLLARTKAGIDVDIALGGLPFEERSVERASTWQLSESKGIFTCSAEDLVVHKVFAARDRDWDDVRGVLTRQHKTLNWTTIRTELVPLLELKEEPELLQQLEKIAAEVTLRLSKKR